MSSKRTRLLLIVLAAGLVAIVAGSLFVWRGRTRLPGPGSVIYEQATRAFYHGLAALEVGLLDDARQRFTTAAELIEDEPASWANLGLTQLRLGDVDAAVAPIERALALAPGNSDIVLLAGRMETARGRLDEAVAHLRRAVELDPMALRARFALVEELERLSSPETDSQAAALLDELVASAPDNLAVLLERTRFAATRRDAAKLRESLSRLEPHASQWSPLVREQHAELQRAVAAGDFEGAARATTLLRNVLAPVPAFIESLVAVRTPAELIAEPFPRFFVLVSPPATPSPPDMSLSFVREELPASGLDEAYIALAVALNGDGLPAVFAADAMSLRRLDQEGRWPLPGGAAQSGNAVVALDWNRDFRTDLVIAERTGLRVLAQGDQGSFSDVTSAVAGASPPTCDCVGAWTADVEMDGDLDIIAADAAGPTIVLRNNGDGTWAPLPTFAGVSGARAFAWADLDADADPDAALLDVAGVVHVFVNRQAGEFARLPVPSNDRPTVALAVADLDADGTFDLVTLDEAGAIRTLSRRGGDWSAGERAVWTGLSGASPGSHRLIAADLDNNGALDLVASGSRETRIWLAREDYRLQPLQAAPEGEVFSIADLDGDGRLDLVGVAEGIPVRHLGRGELNYHWKLVRARAQPTAGDQRVNAFGVGGQIEVRSGLLVQKHVMTGMPVHIGLGTQTAIDVARIVWPNGVPQAEFGVGVDDGIVAEQRLKGSCPWVFAWDGRAIGFVTDFLWRSPLGLRINARDTAGVTQTEDWIKIRSDQLAARNGSYDVRITAELWETHFFDHVSLMVVDHPDDVEIFVDERFSPASPQSLAVRAFEKERQVARAWDHRGRDVSDLVNRRDGRYLASFDRGDYQGIANEHFVELDLGDVMASGTTLIANGWIYPTDSSINVAIGQGGRERPQGVSLEALAADGRWATVAADIGFPAGKNKTMLVDLSGAAGARRVRLRTNLEISWDSLTLAAVADAPVQVTRLAASSADLRFRGYSETVSTRGESPETPIYERIANTAPRWRDLVGYHTRFGNVNELLADVDDRYVIMNAGDELRLLFPEQPPARAGWRRDFVLVGDGWEKDGDYNTGFSQTVLPLPSHDRPAYGADAGDVTLESDPVYRRHRRDWEQFHTRYVTPRTFVGGLRRYVR